MRMGSTFSVYGITSLGSALSVLDFFHMGSSLSLRACQRGGSTISVYGLVRLGSTLSVHREEIFRSASGSALSVYRTARVGCSIGFVDFIQLGSTSSLRAFARLGSGVAVYGMSRLDSADRLGPGGLWRGPARLVDGGPRLRQSRHRAELVDHRAV